MPSDIVENPTKGTPLSCPVDADPRNAASVRVPFQATGNRLAFLEAFYDAFFSALAIAVDATWTVATGKTLTLVGTGTGKLSLAGITVDFNGKTTGILVKQGETGRVPKKPQGGGVPLLTVSATIDPRLTDTYLCEPAAGAITLTLDAQTYTNGEHFRVVNHQTALGYTITIRDAALTTLYVLDSGATDRPAFVDLVYKSGFGWYNAGCNKVI
jgi:hypothetical protein